jgi:hypothetical protein
MLDMTSPRYRVEQNGDRVYVYRNSEESALYVGEFAEEGDVLVERHSHGAETHHHPHAAPHDHGPYGDENFLWIRRDTDGMPEELRMRLILASANFACDNAPPAPSKETVERNLDVALTHAFGGYMRAGMTHQEAEERVRDRVVRVCHKVSRGGQLRSFMAQMEAMADVEIDMEEIERLGRENPLPPQEKANLTGKIIDVFKREGHDASALRQSLVDNLKASGLPTHHYVSNHDDDDVMVAGPFDTASEAADARWVLESNPRNDEINFCVYEGYVVNGKIVAV